MTFDILRTVADEPMTFGELHSRLGRPKKPMLYAALRALADVGLIVHAEGLVRTSSRTAAFLAEHDAPRPPRPPVAMSELVDAWRELFGDESSRAECSIDHKYENSVIG